MPSLTNVYLPNAFHSSIDVTVTGGGHPSSPLHIDIGALTSVAPFTSYEYCRSVLDGSDEITDLVINRRVCPFENVTAFDLSKYPKLKTLKIGIEGFEYVNEVNITGLNELESVVIGNNSFTKRRNGSGNDPNRHFYLKNCPNLESLKIDRYSFSDYTVFEIENVDALEEIVIGDLSSISYSSYNFNYASLELKSVFSWI